MESQGKIKIVSVILFVHFLFPVFTEAQWQPDVRLTNDQLVSRTSFSNAKCVSASGDIVHVVWFTEGEWEIYYKRSTDGGISWSQNFRLTNNPAFSRLPSLAVSGSFVHVVWDDTRDGNYEIYYKRSTDAGVNWGADTRITNSNDNSWYPSLSVSDSFVHVVWSQSPGLGSNIFYKRSTNQGLSWGEDERLTNELGGSTNPSVSSYGQFVHISWCDNKDGNYELYYKRSLNAGSTFDTTVRLTNDSSASYNASIGTSGLNVHVVWRDYRDGNAEIYYKRSLNAGLNWSSDIRLTYDAAHSGSSNITISDSVLHLVWMDLRDGNDPEIYYKRSTDSGTNWESDTRLTNSIGNSWSPSVAVSGTSVHIVWHDNRDGNWEIYYKRNPTGNPIGIKPLSNEIPERFKLYQNYPNPFNPVTRIRFDIPSRMKITLAVYNLLGQIVDILVEEQLDAGTYETEWIAEKFPSGIYYCAALLSGDLNSSAHSPQTKKMIFIK